MNFQFLLKKTIIYRFIYYPIRVRRINERNKKRHEVFMLNGPEVLRKLVKCMDENNITYWLEFGSLLGPYRDGAFVPNERDLDVGAFLSDARLIYRAMTASGFKLCREFHIVGENGLEQTYEYNGVTIDFMFFFEEEGQYWCNGAVIPTQRRNGLPFVHQVTSHHFSKFTCKSFEFMGMNVSIPANTEQHLVEIFGEGFRVYDPNFKVDLNKTFYSMNCKKGIGFFVS